MEAAKISNKFNHLYEIRNTTACSDFLISSCDAVGIADPFPGDLSATCHSNFAIPQSALDFVYPKTRLSEQRSPLTIYLPTKEVMLKLMRACIGVQAIDQLWFNQKEQYSFVTSAINIEKK